MTAKTLADRNLSTPAATLVILGLILFLLAPSASALGNSGSGFFSTDNDFLPVEKALPFNYTSESGSLVLNWDVAPGYYLYKGRISVEASTGGVSTGPLAFSRDGEITEDDYFGKVTVFYEPVTARMPVTLPEGTTEATFRVTFQGCAKAGLCYPPQTRDVLYYPGDGASAVAPSDATRDSSPPAGSAAPLDTESATGLAGFLAGSSAPVIVGLFFLLGLGLTFTPCVLPMVPIISTLVSGHNTRTTGHALLLAITYVLGMALTYAAAGVITGLLGASFNLQAQLQSPWILGTFAVVFVLFAMSMFDLFDIQLPRFLRDSLNNASHRLSPSRVAGIFGIGALSALIVSPCVSAPLAGSLLYISTTQDAVIGGLALFALGLGMGVPLILVSVGGRRMLPANGRWMTTVKHFYGVLMLAVAIWLLERMVPAWLTLLLWGLLVGITGVQLGAFDSAKAGWERTRKGLGLVLFAYGLALLAGALSGASDPLKPLAPFTGSSMARAGDLPSASADFQRVTSPDRLRELLDQANRQGRPAMLDFYADWCISCKVMERTVFSDGRVGEALQPYTLLQLDITDNTPEQQALLNELGIFGPPAILFYNGRGKELENQRVLGEMDRDQFLDHLDSVARAL